MGGWLFRIVAAYVFAVTLVFNAPQVHPTINTAGVPCYDPAPSAQGN